jgi:hypothetical protein
MISRRGETEENVLRFEQDPCQWLVDPQQDCRECPDNLLRADPPEGFILKEIDSIVLEQSPAVCERGQKGHDGHERDERGANTSTPDSAKSAALSDHC